MQNRRKQIRYADNQSVEFVINDTRYTGFLLNRSSGGAFIRWDRSVEIGDTVRLTYQAKGTGTKWEMERVGKITRINEEGIAIQFDRIEDPDFKHGKSKWRFNRYKTPQHLSGEKRN